MIKFSVCIPNYNYGRYIGRTIQSVLDQTYDNFEIVVSDNASTDDSLDVIRSFKDSRIRLFSNRCNVGFAGNLDRATRPAVGDYFLLLSSDDLLRPNALQVYHRIFERLGEEAAYSVISSGVDEIDAQDEVRRFLPIPKLVWNGASLEPRFDADAPAPLYGLDADALLRQCILRMYNPFLFPSTVYPRALYESVEGYGGGRLMNPDKWFHWKLLTQAHRAYYLDYPLSAYRVHNSNQLSVQAKSGALKLPIDDYVSSFELPADVLDRLKLSRVDVERAYVSHSLVHNALAALARGDRNHARRLLDFAKATYRNHLNRNIKGYALRLLLGIGPLGTSVAQVAGRYYKSRRPSA